MKKGDYIELVATPNDPWPIEAGSRGTVTSDAVTVFDREQYEVDWDDGRNVALVVPPDEVRVLHTTCPWCKAAVKPTELRGEPPVGCARCIDWRASAFCSIRNAPDPQCEGCRGTGRLPIRNRAGERVSCDCWAWCDNHDRLCGLDEPSSDDWLADGTAVWAADGSQRGVIRGRRRCQLEGCSGMAVRVIWPDGKVTWPCSKGLRDPALPTRRERGDLQIAG